MSTTVADLRAVVTLDASSFRQGIRDVRQDLQDTAEQTKTAEQNLRDLYRTGRDLEGLGRVLTIGVTAPIMAVGTEVLKSAVRMDALKHALDATTGSAKESAAQLGRLREMAKDPGVGFEEAIQSTIVLQNAGLKAELAERAIRGFGNALAQAGRGKEDMVEVERVLAKIAAKDMISAIDIRQLAIRVPQIRHILQEAFGTNDSKAIQASGLSAEQIIERIVYGLENLRKTGQTARSEIDNMWDSINQGAAKVGSIFLPTVIRIVKTVGGAVEGLADNFVKLPKWMQDTIVVAALLAAAFGPVILAVGMTVTAVAQAVRGFESLWNIVGKLTGTKAVTAAIADETKARVVNTAAVKAQEVAITQEMAKEVEKTAVSRTLAVALGGEAAAYTALGGAQAFKMLNTSMGVPVPDPLKMLGPGAGGAAAAAGGAGAGVAGAGAETIGGLGAAGIAGIMALFFGAMSYMGSGVQDKKNNPGTKDMGFLKNMGAIPDVVAGWFGIQPEIGATTDSEKLEFQLKKMMGDTPAERAKKAAAARPDGYGSLPEGEKARRKREQEEAEIARLKTDQEIDLAKAGMNPESTTRAQDMATRLIPLLRKQAADLKTQAEKTAHDQNASLDDRKLYMTLLHQEGMKEVEIQRLQGEAFRERQTNARRASNERYRINEMQFNIREQDALARSQGAAPHELQQAEAANVIPVLRGRQLELVEQAKRVRQDTTTEAEAQQRYWGIVDEYHKIENRIGAMARSAQEERRKNGERTQREYTEAMKAQQNFVVQRARIMAANAPDDEQAEIILRATLPGLRQEQDEIVERVKSLKPTSKEYWDQSLEFWRIEGDIQSQARNIVKQRDQAAKEAHRAEVAAAQDHRELLSLETRVMEARLKNNPLLSDQDRQRLMIPMLIKQYRAMMRPVEGETMKEALQRQLDMENMRHDIYESMGVFGKGGSARTLGGGRLPMFDRRLAGQIERELNRPWGTADDRAQLSPETVAQRMAKDAAKGAPVVVQVTWQPGMTRREVGAEVEALLDKYASHNDPTGAR